MKKNKYVGIKTLQTPNLNKQMPFINKMGKKYIVIEGTNHSSDQEVYIKVKGDNCNLLPSGKKEEIIDGFKKIEDNKIAIVDKDYDENEVVDNIYYTDYNDIECTAINIIDNSNEIYSSLKIEGMSKDDFKDKVYIKTMELSCNISNLNKFIKDFNDKNNKKYKYILRLFVDKDSKKTTIGDVRRINTFLSKNNNIKYDEIVNVYKKEYKDFSITENEIKEVIESNTYNAFRGHDFFILLAYFIDFYNLKIGNDLNDRLKFESSDFLEKRFIGHFAETQRIKESKLYKDIVAEKEGYFK